MSALDVRNNSAMMKRAEQLKRWEESDTNRAPHTPRSENGRKIKFSSGCVFLAACLSADKEEVVQLLEQGADVNTANIDGLTALHQACIDDNLDMVEFLIEHGADINRQDNEGWTPLHATASCGFVSIARYLVENGADVAAVNSDGDLALDLAIHIEHLPMIEYMEKVVQELNIDVEEARKAEEQTMLNDAKKWLRSDASEVDRPHPKTGATALHVAAAKGYTKVLSLLLAARADVDKQDNDGWTPLHAATHWGQKETAEMLIESLADMEIQNYAGQTCIDVADRKITKYLEELRVNKRNKRRPSSQIKISDTVVNHVDKTPSKITRVELRSDASKHATPSTATEDNSFKDFKDGVFDNSCSITNVIEPDEYDSDLTDSTESSHSTSLSEPEADSSRPISNQPLYSTMESPSEEDAPWRRKTPRTQSDSHTQNQVPEKDINSKSNSFIESNEVILRRTQSFENDDKFYQKYHELRERIKANSCPILPASAINTMVKKQSSNNNNSICNNNNNKCALGLVNTRLTNINTTATSYTCSSTPTTNTITLNTSTTNTISIQNSTIQRSASFKDNSVNCRIPVPVVTLDPPTVHSSTATTPQIRSRSSNLNIESSSHSTNSIKDNGSTISVAEIEAKLKPSAGNIFKNFFKSFVPPVRDEESETQRKAHAKRVRETRRSTQGVTLDEIKSAEELVKKKNLGINANNNNNSNFKLDDVTSGASFPSNKSTIIPSAPAVIAAANLSTTSISHRRISAGNSSNNASNQTNSSVRPTSMPVTSTPNTINKLESPTSTSTSTKNIEDSVLSDNLPMTPSTKIAITNTNATEKDNDKENETRTALASQTIIQRRRKPKRRSTGVVHIDIEDLDSERNEAPTNDNNQKESGSERFARTCIDSSTSNISNSANNEGIINCDKEENTLNIDYKALWETAKIENDKLKQMLKQKDEEVVQIKSTLERFTNATTKNSLSEIEKRERRAMERKLSELEEELKLLQKLKSENERLRAENRALTRVVSKLTTSAQSQLAKSK